MWVTCRKRARFSFFPSIISIVCVRECSFLRRNSNRAPTFEARWLWWNSALARARTVKHSQFFPKDVMLINCFLLSSSLLKLQKLFIS
ncbi:hypothetical protein L7F22_058963 [Adiantum nelumboides]|nr:hypothetical protein [Adiantum nelumboides]